jgi:hypothetical protein
MLAFPSCREQLVSPHTIYVAYAVVEINRSIVIPLIVRVMEASCKNMSLFDTDILG